MYWQEEVKSINELVRKLVVENQSIQTALNQKVRIK